MLEMRKSVSSERSSLLRTKRRLERAHHQHQPEHQADEEQDLPEAAEVDVFISLAAEPEPHVAEALLDAQPLAGERSADDQHNAPKSTLTPRR